MRHLIISLTMIAAGAMVFQALPVAAQTAPADQSKKRPNVVLILADDLGWSDTGAFGSEIETPNINKLAASGKKFTHFYNTARCCPSRACLLTGLYPHEAGVGHMLWPTGYPGYSTRLSSESVTMAEVLHDSGYGTYMAGKWHLAERQPDPADPTGWPLQRGFDKFYGTLAGYGSYFDPATLCRGNTYITPENDADYKPDLFYYTDAISDNAVKFMEEHEKAEADKPFFMYVAYTAAHWPLMVPEDTLSKYKGKYDAGYQAIRDKRYERLVDLGLVDDVKTSSPTVGDWDAVKNKQWEARRMEAFAAVIDRMDQGIGKILKHLEEAGELDNTIVLYIQDNGGCDEEFFQNNHKKPANVHKMGPDELQTRTLPPMQTRDGKVVRTGEEVMAGPADSFLGYGPGWANVSNTPLRKFKRFTYEGGISTPLIVHWPAGIGNPHGQLVPNPSHLIDIMPTLVELTGAKYPTERNGNKIQPMEGESLVPLLTGNGTFHRDEPIFWEHEGSRAVRNGKWKIVADEYKPWELYDISVDRGETNNLADEHPEIVKEMAAAWDSYKKRARVEPYGAHALRKRRPDPENAPTHVELTAGDTYAREYAPSLSDAGVSITATISEMAPEGVIVAQGAGAAGFTLYLQNGIAHFAVRRAHKLLTLDSKPIIDNGPAIIKARLNYDGTASLQINNKPPVTANFYGPLLETPDEGLTVGWDQDGPVGEYPTKFSFTGQIEKVVVETLKDQESDGLTF